MRSRIRKLRAVTTQVVISWLTTVLVICRALLDVLGKLRSIIK